MLIDKALDDKLSSEEAIYTQIKKYNDDASCNHHVINFKESLEEQLKDFHISIISSMKELITKSVLDKLASITLQKEFIAVSLQNEMIDEVILDFKNKFASNKKLQDDIIKSAISEIEQDYSNEPVTTTIINTLKDIQNNKSPIIAKLESSINDKEKELIRSCTIRYVTDVLFSRF